MSLYTEEEISCLDHYPDQILLLKCIILRY
jgi:hypothetical protein